MIPRTKSSPIALIGILAATNLVLTPAEAGLHSGIRQLFSGPSAVETCAVLADRRAYCWGEFTSEATSLLQIGKDIESIALGFEFRCALTTDGKVSCWGNNDVGQLGNGSSSTPSDTPRRVQYLGADFDNVSDITAGTSHACALRAGAAWCWGYNGDLEIGNSMLPSSTNALEPTQVLVTDPMRSLPLDNLHAISAGGNHTCALFNDDTGACWGDDQYGQLANAMSRMNFASPQTIEVDSGGLQALVMGGGHISGGSASTCALVSDVVANSVACWGFNSVGQLGIGSTSNKATAYPATAGGGKIVDATDVAMSGASACAILVDTTLRCWGSDEHSELGWGAGGSNAVTGIVLLASKIGGSFSGAIQVVAGLQHFCVRTLGDEVYCWGDNEWGQIGSGVGTSTAVPTKVAIDAPLFTDNFDND
jgi:alpha-tubulin suppressor-like RCC1 family protein